MPGNMCFLMAPDVRQDNSCEGKRPSHLPENRWETGARAPCRQAPPARPGPPHLTTIRMTPAPPGLCFPGFKDKVSPFRKQTGSMFSNDCYTFSNAW